MYVTVLVVKVMFCHYLCWESLAFNLYVVFLDWVRIYD